MVKRKDHTKIVGRTTSNGRPAHIHEYRIDRQGNGFTTNTTKGKGHKHKVVNFRVMVELEGEPHIHALKADPINR